MHPRKQAGFYRLVGGLWYLPAFLVVLVLYSGSLTMAQEIEDCMECHGNPEDVGRVVRVDQETGEVKVANMLVDEDAFMQSAHGRSEEGFVCIDCHQDLDGVYGEHAPLLQPVDCITFCHDDPAEEFLESTHVEHMEEKEKTPPRCTECHMGRNSARETPVADDPFHRAHVNKTCGRCHEDYLFTYCSNLHGQLSSLGVCTKDVPNCFDCHNGHDILKSDDPDSKVGENNKIETCSECHKGADKNFVKHIAHPGFKTRSFYAETFKTFKEEGILGVLKQPHTYLALVFLMYMGIIGFTFTAFGSHAFLMWIRILLDERKDEGGHDH
ncbi:MAG: hypothetical protein ACE5IC_02960 [Candidatus Brocadiales bacterium]